VLTHKPQLTHTTSHKELNLSHSQTQVGTIIKLNHVVQKVLMKLQTIVFNATPHMSSIQLIKNADHVHLITYLTTKPEDVIVKFHVKPQDKLTQPTINANVKLSTEQE
jgi:hypothetical protein